jgi:hypothetical protein
MPPAVPGCRDRITLFVDALDENQNQDDNGTLLSIFDDLIATHRDVRGKPDTPILKVCLASRPWPIFQERLGDNRRVPSFAMHNFTMQDIRQYAMAHTLRALGQRQKSISDLSTDIASRAKGVFIWVRIVVDNLRQEIVDGTPIESLQKILYQYPEELDGMYKLTMQRVRGAYLPETMIILKTMLASRVPLYVHQLYIVTNICIGNQHGLPQSVDDMISWLASRTGGLISMVDTGANDDWSTVSGSDSNATTGRGPASDFSTRTNLQVEFLHQTVQDFVRNGLESNFKTDNTTSSVAQLSGSRLLALACLDSHPPHTTLRDVARDTFSYIREVEREEDEGNIQQMTSLPHWDSFDLHDFPFRIRDRSHHSGFRRLHNITYEISYYQHTWGSLDIILNFGHGYQDDRDLYSTNISGDTKPFLTTIMNNLYHTKGTKYLFTLEPASARDVCRVSLFIASVGPRMTNDRTDRPRMFQHVLDSFVAPWKAKHPAEAGLLEALTRLPCRPVNELIDGKPLPRFPTNLACVLACLKPSTEVDDSTLLAFAQGLRRDYPRRLSVEVPIPVLWSGPVVLEFSMLTMTTAAFCSRFRDINRAKWVELFRTLDGNAYYFDLEDEHPPFVDLAVQDAVNEEVPEHAYTQVAHMGNFTAQAIASACLPAAVIGLGNSLIFRAFHPSKKGQRDSLEIQENMYRGIVLM